MRVRVYEPKSWPLFRVCRPKLCRQWYANHGYGSKKDSVYWGLRLGRRSSSGLHGQGNSETEGGRLWDGQRTMCGMVVVVVVVGSLLSGGCSGGGQERAWLWAWAWACRCRG